MQSAGKPGLRSYAAAFAVGFIVQFVLGLSVGAQLAEPLAGTPFAWWGISVGLAIGAAALAGWITGLRGPRRVGLVAVALLVTAQLLNVLVVVFAN